MSGSELSVVEKPQNGIAGLKHLRHDILSGLVVSLVSLPLSSGIAIASGCPPIVGLMSAVIAGLLFPFIGGAYLTISGPAAGLAPALMAVMVSLGGAGDADKLGAGYPFLLCVIFLVGCCQLIISVLGLARYAAMIPVAVVEGMLASIGLTIIVKQFPSFFGFTGKVHAHEFYQYITGLPEYAQHLTTPVFLTSLITLVSLFGLAAMQKRVRLIQILPPQLIAVVIGVVAGQILNLGSLNDGKFLISIPSNMFANLQTPHFGELLARRDLWYAAIMGVVMLTTIDAVESLATAMAIDRIDPWRRRSAPNRVLLAMALSNIASSLIGGLTIIPGGVKSKVNIAAGGRTLWANFTNSVCLILYIAVGYQLINLIPRGVLASVLLFTGWKMCEPAVWRHVAHIGRDQLAVFTFTVIVTLATDLLVGIVAGVAAKFLLSAWTCRRAVAANAASEGRRSSFFDLFTNPVVHKGWIDSDYHIYVEKPVVWFNKRMLQRELDHLPADASSVVVHMDSQLSLWESLVGFFLNPVERTELRDGEYQIHINRPLVCFSSMKLAEVLEAIPEEADTVQIHIHDNVTLIDHTTCDQLQNFVVESKKAGRSVQLIGIDRLTPVSHHPSSSRSLAGMAKQHSV